jgi:regulator of replication initiation timing
VELEGIEEVEAEVNEIQRLYEENQFLRSMNEEIKQRIEKKQIQLAGSKK